MNLSDYAQTTLAGAQANTLVSVQARIVTMNASLAGVFRSAFSDWLINWNAGQHGEENSQRTLLIARNGSENYTLYCGRGTPSTLLSVRNEKQD
jgi:hypothetical protein